MSLSISIPLSCFLPSFFLSFLFIIMAALPGLGSSGSSFQLSTFYLLKTDESFLSHCRIRVKSPVLTFPFQSHPSLPFKKDFLSSGPYSSLNSYFWGFFLNQRRTSKLNRPRVSRWLGFDSHLGFMMMKILEGEGR